MNENCLDNFHEIIEKSYLRYYVEKVHKKNQDNYSVHSDFGVS